MTDDAPEVAASAAAFVSAIQARLDTRWLARELHGLDETDSTNRAAAELAARGADHGTTVVAEAQTAGRGRHGRSFFSPAARNLYTSVILRPGEAGSPAPTTVLCAGVAVAEAVAATLNDRGRVQIKWPNDVLIDGLKTSGILMEAIASGTASATGSEGGHVGILGIGVNLNLARSELPEEFRERATSVAHACGKSVNRPAFAALLYGTLERVLESHQRGGFEAVRDAFESFFQMRDELVRVTDLGGELRAEGTVRGVASDGALRLVDARGAEHRVLAGDVTVAKGAEVAKGSA